MEADSAERAERAKREQEQAEELADQEAVDVAAAFERDPGRWNCAGCHRAAVHRSPIRARPA